MFFTACFMKNVEQMADCGPVFKNVDRVVKPEEVLVLEVFFPFFFSTTAAMETKLVRGVNQNCGKLKTLTLKFGQNTWTAIAA